MNPDLLRMAGQVFAPIATAGTALAPIATLLGLGGMAVNALKKPAGRAAQTAIGTGAATGVPGLGANQPTPFVPVAAVPTQLQGLNSPITSYDVVNPMGPFAAGRLQELKEGDVALENMKKIAPYQYQLMSQAKKDEMQRQLAAAQIRQNIATQADAVQSGLHTAQAMGLNASSQLGGALAAQYQYQ